MIESEFGVFVSVSHLIFILVLSKLRLLSHPSFGADLNFFPLGFFQLVFFHLVFSAGFSTWFFSAGFFSLGFFHLVFFHLVFFTWFFCLSRMSGNETCG